MFQRSSPFYRRIPINMVGTDHLILENFFEKARGFEITQPPPKGSRTLVMETEVSAFRLPEKPHGTECSSNLRRISTVTRDLFHRYRHLTAIPVFESMAMENIAELVSNRGVIDTSLYCSMIVPLSAREARQKAGRRNVLTVATS